MTWPPPQLRWLIRNAVSSYSASHALDLYWRLRQRDGRSHEAAIRQLAVNMERGDREETLSAYGPTHPEARGPIMREALA